MVSKSKKMEQENKILVNGLPKSPSGRLTKYFSGHYSIIYNVDSTWFYEYG